MLDVLTPGSDGRPPRKVGLALTCFGLSADSACATTLVVNFFSGFLISFVAIYSLLVTGFSF